MSPGTKLGSYEIVEPIGRGGMGEVFRARDTKLERDVAIKVLPEAFAADPERMARFEREAKLLAQVNHPGIATLHGLENFDGTQCLVMELVEGETLAERIAREPMSWEEAKLFFAQMAEALEAAHEKGIVHRDLKPSNVKVTPDGKIKILDFGLAKLADAATETPGEGASQSPTLTRGTALGVILGTASYMSPEQARGKSVDRRTDVWALGCCLFEALAGRKAFEGETVTDILAKVVQSEPDLEAVPASTRPLLARMLRKDPRRRIQHVGDVRIAIEEAEAASVERTPRARVSTPAVLAAFALGAVAGALMLARRFDPPRVYRYTLPFEVSVDNLRRIALSPDGRALVVRGYRDVFLRDLDREQSRILEGARDASAVAFSSDGESLLFVQGETLKRMSLSGGPATSLAAVDVVAGAHWTSDDFIYFTQDGALERVAGSGGTPGDASGRSRRPSRRHAPRSPGRERRTGHQESRSA